jgi:hypothetical protein
MPDKALHRTRPGLRLGFPRRFAPRRAGELFRSAFLSTLEMGEGEITDCRAFWLPFAAEGGTELGPERRAGAPGPSNAPTAPSLRSAVGRQSGSPSGKPDGVRVVFVVAGSHAIRLTIRRAGWGLEADQPRSKPPRACPWVKGIGELSRSRSRELRPPRACPWVKGIEELWRHSLSTRRAA